MNRSSRIIALGALVFALMLPLVAKKKPPEPLSTLNFLVVGESNGKPVRNAAVVMHPVDEYGNQTAGGLELKTSPDGKASYEGIPYGKLRVQVLAHGFQTYGEDYDVEQDSMDITIKLKPPAKQYSIYESHPDAQKPPTPDEKKPQ